MHLITEDIQFFVGDVVYEKSGSFGPRRQTFLQLVYLHNGSALVKHDHGSFSVTTSQAFWMHAGRTYRIEFSKNERVRHGWIDMRTYVPPPNLQKRLDALAEVFPASKRLFQLCAMARTLTAPFNSSQRRLHDDLARAALSEAFLIAGLDAEPVEELPEAVVRAQAFIRTQYGAVLALPQIARAAGVSIAHLIRLFKQHTGRTPMQTLWHTRVSEGCRLLRQTGLNVSEIALRCGFQTPYHFSRLIKRATGKPPRTYRQSHWRDPLAG
ncbi:MAG: helix-turn-helix domain-containing protein [Opitutales bacterium]